MPLRTHFAKKRKKKWKTRIVSISTYCGDGPRCWKSTSSCNHYYLSYTEDVLDLVPPWTFQKIEHALLRYTFVGDRISLIQNSSPWATMICTYWLINQCSEILVTTRMQSIFLFDFFKPKYDTQRQIIRLIKNIFLIFRTPVTFKKYL